MIRPPKDAVYLAMATVMAERSTCMDKQVGCIIINKKNEIIATGYNGAPRGFEHCCDLGRCTKEETGNPLKCLAAHAEENALLQCRVPEQIHTVYVTLSPCVACTRLLMNTACERIVFAKEHRHHEAEQLWKGEWVHYGQE